MSKRPAEGSKTGDGFVTTSEKTIRTMLVEPCNILGDKVAYEDNDEEIFWITLESDHAKLIVKIKTFSDSPLADVMNEPIWIKDFDIVEPKRLTLVSTRNTSHAKNLHNMHVTRTPITCWSSYYCDNAPNLHLELALDKDFRLDCPDGSLSYPDSLYPHYITISNAPEVKDIWAETDRNGSLLLSTRPENRSAAADLMIHGHAGKDGTGFNHRDFTILHRDSKFQDDLKSAIKNVGGPLEFDWLSKEDYYMEWRGKESCGKIKPEDCFSLTFFHIYKKSKVTIFFKDEEFLLPENFAKKVKVTFHEKNSKGMIEAAREEAKLGDCSSQRTVSTLDQKMTFGSYFDKHVKVTANKIKDSISTEEFTFRINTSVDFPSDLYGLRTFNPVDWFSCSMLSSFHQTDPDPWLGEEETEMELFVEPRLCIGILFCIPAGCYGYKKKDQKIFVTDVGNGDPKRHDVWVESPQEKSLPGNEKPVPKYHVHAHFKQWKRTTDTKITLLHSCTRVQEKLQNHFRSEKKRILTLFRVEFLMKEMHLNSLVGPSHKNDSVMFFIDKTFSKSAFALKVNAAFRREVEDSQLCF